MDIEVRYMFVDLDGVRKQKKTVPAKYKSYFNKLTKLSEETTFVCEPICRDYHEYYDECDDDFLLELFKQEVDSAVFDLILKPRVQH